MATSVAVIGAAGLAIALPAVASTTTIPPWQPGTSAGGDPNNVGTLKFFNASGTQIYGGSTTTQIAKYIESQGLTPVTGNKKAAIFYATPVFGQNPGVWNTSPGSGSTTFPATSAPAPVKTFTDPVATTTSSDESLDSAFTQFPNTDTTDAGYVNVYEVRLFDTGTAGQDSNYGSADIMVDTSAHTWTEIYPDMAPAVHPGDHDDEPPSAQVWPAQPRSPRRSRSPELSRLALSALSSSVTTAPTSVRRRASPPPPTLSPIR